MRMKFFRTLKLFQIRKGTMYQASQSASKLDAFAPEKVGSESKGSKENESKPKPGTFAPETVGSTNEGSKEPTKANDPEYDTGKKKNPAEKVADIGKVIKETGGH